MKVYVKEDLSYKNIILSEEGKPPEKIEIDGENIRVFASSGKVFEIPLNTLRGKALLDRLHYQGELTQEIYI
ncbi:MAG: pantothenate kinase [Aquificaceae bacterium]|nr:pantothenate kinase [Aquificaceae bacterium]MCS7277661.1 pantothenate kinase [Aquificaceae bacterium]MDW8066765.1 pantothenate kinase [Aquificaceae bacterium]MDW8422872.1 pantothenate kinase [Aquificaceae bacterium]